MEIKYFLFFLLNFIIDINSSPINEHEVKLKSLIRGNTCDFPPMFLATDVDYSTQFQGCSEDQQNPALKQICSELEFESTCDLKKNSDTLKIPVTLPITNVTLNLKNGKVNVTDQASYVQEMCQYMTPLTWTQEECVKECSQTFFICDLYVTMDKILRNFFVQEVQNYTHLDVFVFSGSLGFLYPFPSIGSLHNKDLLKACSSPTEDEKVKLLCKVVAEVAVNYVKNRVKVTFHERDVTINVTSIWNPCKGMSVFTSLSSSQDFQQLTQNCDILCLDYIGICKMIYLGLEKYQVLTAGSSTSVTTLQGDNTVIKPQLPGLTKELAIGENPQTPSGGVKINDASITDAVSSTLHESGVPQTGEGSNGVQQTEAGNPEVQQPGVHQPEVHQPEVQQPGVQKPGVQQPVVQQPEVQQPGVQQPEVQQPGVQQPEVQQPGVQQPEVQQPEVQQPGVQQPGVQQPVVQQHEVQQPGVQQPGVQQPVVQQPEVQQPGVQQPVVQQPEVQQPGVQQPGVQQPGVQQPVVQQPEVQQPEVQQPGVQQPVVQQPEVQQPGVQQPEVQQPGVQQPVVQQPEVQQPVVQQPEVQQPGVQQPEVQQPEVQQPEVQQQGAVNSGVNQPEVQQPGVQQPEVQQPGASTSTNAPGQYTLDDYYNGDFPTESDEYLDRDPSPLANQLDRATLKPEHATNDNAQQSNGRAVVEDDSSGSHFMAYFLVFIVLSIAGYIVFHNKQKIIALVIEGKTGKGGRRPNTKEYKQLKTDDVMPSLEKSAYSKDYVF